MKRQIKGKKFAGVIGFNDGTKLVLFISGKPADAPIFLGGLLSGSRLLMICHKALCSITRITLMESWESLSTEGARKGTSG